MAPIAFWKRAQIKMQHTPSALNQWYSGFWHKSPKTTCPVWDHNCGRGAPPLLPFLHPPLQIFPELIPQDRLPWILTLWGWCGGQGRGRIHRFLHTHILVQHSWLHVWSVVCVLSKRKEKRKVKSFLQKVCTSPKGKLLRGEGLLGHSHHPHWGHFISLPPGPVTSSCSLAWLSGVTTLWVKSLLIGHLLKRPGRLQIVWGWFHLCFVLSKTGSSTWVGLGTHQLSSPS